MVLAGTDGFTTMTRGARPRPATGAISRTKLKPSLIEHQIEIDQDIVHEVSNLILGDFKLLSHAIGNLLLNSIHYSPEKSKIFLPLHLLGIEANQQNLFNKNASQSHMRCSRVSHTVEIHIRL